MRMSPPLSPTFPHLAPTLQNPLKPTPTPTFYRGVGVVGGKCGKVGNAPPTSRSARAAPLARLDPCNPLQAALPPRPKDTPQ